MSTSTIIGIKTAFVGQTPHGYICRAEVHDSAGQSIEMVEEGESLLAARTKSLASAEREYRARFQAEQPAPSLLTRGHEGNAHSRDKFNGGGNKPVSQSQKALIRKIADERSIAVTPLCHELFAKGVEDLTGEEANEVIRRMKQHR